MRTLRLTTVDISTGTGAGTPAGRALGVDDATLVSIVQRASTLEERLGPSFEVRHTDPRLVDARLAAWRRAVQPDPSGTAFASRLALDDLSEEDARRAVSDVRLRAALPPWASTLRELLEASLEDRRPLSPGPPGEDAVPFQEVLEPWVEVGVRRLEERVGSLSSQLAPEARRAHERSLLLSLAQAVSRALYVDFSVLVARPRFDATGLVFSGCLPGDVSRERYLELVARMRTGGILDLVDDAPVLGRLAALLVDRWVDRGEELLARLADDVPAIADLFNAGRDPGPVVALNPDLSDSHAGGRTVFGLRFQSGLELVYKPKGLGVDVAFGRFVDELNLRSGLLRLRAAAVLDRGTHGWVERVPHPPCEDAAAIERYYERAGMLLAVLYVLEASDCHYENVIACGEEPVLIDLETLVQHRPRTFEEGDQAAERALWGTVLKSLFLPRWQVGPDGNAYDISGLLGTGGQEGSGEVAVFRDVNTDRMTLRFARGRTTPSANLPWLAGDSAPPFSDQAAVVRDAVVRGFTRLYEVLIREKDGLATALEGFAEVPVRFVARHTATYHALLTGTFDPAVLKDGVAWSLHLEPLTRAGAKGTDAESRELWPLIREELRALRELDIPRFEASTSSDALDLPDGGVVRRAFSQASLELVASRLANVSAEDLERQLVTVRASLATSLRGSDHVRAAGSPRAKAAGDPEAIAAEIERTAHRGANGSASWISLVYLPSARQHQLSPLGFCLYDGTCGVALFLAALARITGKDRWADLARAALVDVRTSVARGFGREVVRDLGLGGGFGAGSVIYALSVIGCLLDDEPLLDAATALAGCVSEDDVRREERVDVLNGLSGLVLGLLALDTARESPTALRLARLAGDRILASRVPSPEGPRAWRTLDGKLLTGFSHGASGIAVALSRLHRRLSDETLASAAREALDYEARLGFRDLRLPPPAQGSSWCHGAPGMGLARLEIASVESVASAVEATLALPPAPHDGLCCGSLGRAELLLAAGRTLGEPEWLAAAAREGSRMKAEGFDCGSLEGGPSDPGLFQGSAGVGYQLLRLAHPERLPSLLSFEAF